MASALRLCLANSSSSRIDRTVIYASLSITDIRLRLNRFFKDMTGSWRSISGGGLVQYRQRIYIHIRQFVNRPAHTRACHDLQLPHLSPRLALLDANAENQRTPVGEKTTHALLKTRNCCKRIALISHLSLSTSFNSFSICSGAGRRPLKSSRMDEITRYVDTPIGPRSSPRVYSTVVRSFDLQIMIPVEEFLDSSKILTQTQIRR